MSAVENVVGPGCVRVDRARLSPYNAGKVELSSQELTQIILHLIFRHSTFGDGLWCDWHIGGAPLVSVFVNIGKESPRTVGDGEIGNAAGQ